MATMGAAMPELWWLICCSQVGPGLLLVGLLAQAHQSRRNRLERPHRSNLNGLD